MNQFVTVTKLGPGTELRIDRPDRFNGIGPTIAGELNQAIDQIRAEKAPPFIVLSAVPKETRHGRVWIAGGDLKELADISDPAAARDFAEKIHRFVFALRELPSLTIAFIDGLAIGGAAELAMHCDLRFGSAEAGLYFKQLEIGITTGFLGTARLVELFGRAAAQRILLLRQKYDVHEALANGLIDLQLGAKAHEDLIQWMDEFLEQCPTETILQQKRLIGVGADLDYHSCSLAELDGFARLWKNKQHLRVLDGFHT